MVHKYIFNKSLFSRKLSNAKEGAKECKLKLYYISLYFVTIL